jgi:ABC-type antimicrobial peptide transport system permease subunit
LIAVTLALVGIFGTTAYFVAQRTQEIGVRMALGARPPAILALVMGRGARMAAVGSGLGLAGSYGLTRWMADLLFEVSPTDPAVFAAGPALLLAVALLACYLPARRAVRIDPAVTLRQE